MSEALDVLGVVTQRKEAEVRRRMAVGMFDTRGKVDPFDPNSPIQKCAVQTFPQVGWGDSGGGEWGGRFRSRHGRSTAVFTI